MAKTVLVSGGAGYIGSHVTVELIAAGYEVVVADNFSNCDMTCYEGVKKITGRNDIPLYEIDCCDIASVDKLFTEHQIDAVIHFAAFKAVGESVSEPIKYYSNNLVSFLNVLEVARKHGGCNVLFSSSATVYGESEVLPVTEQTPRMPALPGSSAQRKWLLRNARVHMHTEPHRAPVGSLISILRRPDLPAAQSFADPHTQDLPLYNLP